jgi:hypothetical protein
MSRPVSSLKKVSEKCRKLRSRAMRWELRRRQLQQPAAKGMGKRGGNGRDRRRQESVEGYDSMAVLTQNIQYLWSTMYGVLCILCLLNVYVRSALHASIAHERRATCPPPRCGVPASRFSPLSGSTPMDRSTCESRGGAGPSPIPQKPLFFSVPIAAVPLRLCGWHQHRRTHKVLPRALIQARTRGCKPVERNRYRG